MMQRPMLPQNIPGPQQILKALAGSLGLSAPSGLEFSETNSLACSKPELSCHAQYTGQDTCCFNYPGGELLQTQFWDSDPAIGPDDSWTIHGLWPDYCDGSFDQFCDPNRRYNNISLILIDAGRGDLLDYMSTYWKDNRGDDPNLWYHEWSKHGTCVSTLETKCYTDYQPQQEVVDYFDKAVELFQTRPSYHILADAGIVPSFTKTYTRSEIEGALSKAHGSDVAVRCHYGSLNEIWYYFNVAGSLQTGKFVSSAPDSPKSNCPAHGIKYHPKRPKNEPSEPFPGNPGPADPSSNRGNLMVSTMGQRRGCIISRGTWFTAGTCATFRTKKVSDDSFTLTSSKGPCTIEQDMFICGPHIQSPNEFSIEGGKLSFQGNTSFFADKAPKGHTQSKVYASEDDHLLELEITWFGHD